MQWYVLLIAITAAAFLGQVAVELFGRPMRTALTLRRKALKRVLALQNISLPRPRELANSAQAIREYDQAVRNVREAQQALREIADQLLAFVEYEAPACAVLALFGLDVARAGQKLINLSEAYGRAKLGNDELRRAINEARHVSGASLAGFRAPSGNDPIKIQLEPIRVRDVGTQNGAFCGHERGL